MNERAIVGVRENNAGDVDGSEEGLGSGAVRLGKGVKVEGKTVVEGKVEDWGTVGVGARVGRRAVVGEVRRQLAISHS